MVAVSELRCRARDRIPDAMPDPRSPLPEMLPPDIALAISEGWLDLQQVRQLCCVSSKSRATFMTVLRSWELCALEKVLTGVHKPAGVAAIPGGLICVAECEECDSHGNMHGRPGNKFQIIDHASAPHCARSLRIVRMSVGPDIHRTPDQLIVPNDPDEDYVPTNLDAAVACAYAGEDAVLAADVNGLHKFRLSDGKFVGSTIEPGWDDRDAPGWWRFGCLVALATAGGLAFVANDMQPSLADRKPRDTVEVFTSGLTHVRTIKMGKGQYIPTDVAIHDEELYVLHSCGTDRKQVQNSSSRDMAISCFSLEGTFRRTIFQGKNISSFAIARSGTGRDRLVVAWAAQKEAAGYLEVFALQGKPSLRQQIKLDRGFSCCGMCFDPQHRLLFASSQDTDFDDHSCKGEVLVYRIV